MEISFNRKKKRRRMWMQDNQDAKGYPYGDNRVIPSPEQDRRDVVRRTWNF
jgi:hypothetical protein